MTATCAVLFDLDDTLLDAELAWRAGVGHLVATRVGGTADVETAVGAWGEVFARWFDPYLSGRITYEASRIGRIRDWSALLGVRVPNGEELAWFDTYAQGYRRGWSLFDDVAPTLDALRGMPLGLVTNGEGAMQRAKATHLALDAVFSVIVVSGEFGVAKPDPAIFLGAAAALGVDPTCCLMVGDRLDKDVGGALAAGMRAAWVQRPHGPEAATVPPAELAGRFTTLRSLHELPALVGDGGAGR